MRKLLLIAALLLLVSSDHSVAGDDSSGPAQPPQHPAQVSMNAVDDWMFIISPAPSWYDNLWRSHGGWSLQFSLPQPTFRSKSVYFEGATRSPLLMQGWDVKVSGRASPLPAGMDCRVFFQEVGDDLSGQGQYAYYRWLSIKPLIPSANRLGNFVQFVGLEPEFWSRH